MVEGAGYVRASRVGVSYIDARGHTESLIFDPENPIYTVNISAVEEDGFFMRLLHIFVGRYLRHICFKGPFEVWRWHYDSWPRGEEAPPRYVSPVEFALEQEGCLRHSYEHLDGARIINPQMLTMELSGRSLPVANCDTDLVPERDSYRIDPPFLPFPGLEPEEMGATGYFEDLLKHDRPQPRVWVN
jgi:hypothetical protein